MVRVSVLLILLSCLILFFIVVWQQPAGHANYFSFFDYYETLPATELPDDVFERDLYQIANCFSHQFDFQQVCLRWCLNKHSVQDQAEDVINECLIRATGGFFSNTPYIRDFFMTLFRSYCEQQYCQEAASEPEDQPAEE